MKTPKLVAFSASRRHEITKSTQTQDATTSPGIFSEVDPPRRETIETMPSGQKDGGGEKGPFYGVETPVLTHGILNRSIMRLQMLP